MMGLGDWLMASADVKALHERNGRPVVVVGRGGRVQWSEVFDLNPRISRSGSNAQRLENGPGMRPYIIGRTEARWTWRRGRNQQPGELYFAKHEKAFAEKYANYVVIEPNVKQNGHANKAWPFERWQAVVNSGIAPMVQCGSATTRWLDGVVRCETPTFRTACAVLSRSKAFVGTEGALHHAAAALGIPAVVLWSEFIDVDVTGYAGQKNLRHAGDPCGSRVPCSTCIESMLAISVEEVVGALRDQF